jgi:NAD(P)H-dependent flavin oxidoreductase YrpB (nitropropane dioxygenase family)
MTISLTRQFGLDVPIYGFSHSRAVVAAISAAGGLGVLGTVRRTPGELAADLDWVSAHVAGRPFGVDIVYPASAATEDPEHSRDLLPSEHLHFVAGLRERFGIPPADDPGRADLYSGHRLTLGSAREFTELTLNHGVALIVSALGVPPPDLVARIHARGTLLGALVGSPRHARRQVDAGVDIIVAQGTEAGGHVGQLSTLVLVPQVVDAVPGTPVLAAGGIGDGRQLAAVEALGAAGGWLGSIWMTTRESIATPGVKRRLLAASSEDTVVTKAYSGKTVRLLNTPWLGAWTEPGAPAPLRAPLQGLLIHETMTSIAEHDLGELVTSPIGQIVGVMNEEETVASVMHRLTESYRAARRLAAAALA